MLSFQFTTSHGGRQVLSMNMCPLLSLSIHDLTRRSTLILFFLRQISVFQFTTSHGGRPALGIKSPSREAFQFTTSHGGRPRSLRYIQPYTQLSIHDLTRRSTHTTAPAIALMRTFNSRPHTEVDTAPISLAVCSAVFQFTTSHGGRRRF